MKAYKTLYAIPIPQASDMPYSMLFSSRIEGDTYTFLFRWINGAWALFVTLPNGEIRNASTVPGVVSWSAYPDYGLYIDSTLTTVGQNDLGNISLYWIVWA